jgi:hypothetical protein
VRTQKLMWHNIMKSTKSQKVSVLHYSIDSSIKSSIFEAGGYENVTYNQKDVRNFLDKKCRLKSREGDGQALHDYFVRMQDKNSNFYHALDLDDELRVRNVF